MGENSAVVIFAKAPSSGTAKSRIAAQAGRERADAIYRELLQITDQRVGNHTHYVAYHGIGGESDLEQVFSRALGFLPQHGETLGLRVKNALNEVKALGHGALCAIGTDYPEITSEDFDTAFSHLDQGMDVVIGPAEDGGYYLIAVRDPDCGVFSVSGWGTDTLLRETLSLVHSAGLSLSLLKKRSDIDTMEDYKNWKA